jgi:hypothetical protein
VRQGGFAHILGESFTRVSRGVTPDGASHAKFSAERKKKCEISVGRFRGVVLEYTLQV